MENFLSQYGSVLIILIYICVEKRIFVTPEQLLKTKEDIMEQVKNEYATREIADTIKDDIKEIKNQLAKLTDLILSQVDNNKS